MCRGCLFASLHGSGHIATAVMTACTLFDLSMLVSSERGDRRGFPTFPMDIVVISVGMLGGCTNELAPSVSCLLEKGATLHKSSATVCDEPNRTEPHQTKPTKQVALVSSSATDGVVITCNNTKTFEVAGGTLTLTSKNKVLDTN